MFLVNNVSNQFAAVFPDLASSAAFVEFHIESDRFRSSNNINTILRTVKVTCNKVTTINGNNNFN